MGRFRKIHGPPKYLGVTARASLPRTETQTALHPVQPRWRSRSSKRNSPARAEYLRNYRREWMARRRADFFSGKSCVWCGRDTDLQLDHIDPAQKVHHCVWSWSKKRREAELAKCRVLCRPCHERRHAEEATKPLIHGTTNAYNEKGCRCELCRACKRDLMRERRKMLAQRGARP